MPVQFQAELPAEAAAPTRGPVARTRALMVSTATEMMRRGQSPSVSAVAAAAGVSRSTAYRYFPTLAEMLRAVVAEALGPILDWNDASPRGEGIFAKLKRVRHGHHGAHLAASPALLASISL